MAKPKGRRGGGPGPPARSGAGGKNNYRPQDNRPQNRASPAQHYRPRSRSPPYHRRPRSRSPRRDLPQHRAGATFQFGQGQSYRPARDEPRFGGEDQARNQEQERFAFTFRSDVSTPKFPSQDRKRQFDRPEYRQGSRRNDGFRRENRRFPKTHNRPIMRALHEGERTPERLDGMSEGPNRYKALGEAFDLADSESAENSDLEPSHKKQKTAAETESTATPKWSNPDPYTALPPPDESRAKRMDVVKLIKNARLSAAEEKLKPENAITDNADFVPLDFGSIDDKAETEEAEEYSPPEPVIGELKPTSNLAENLPELLATHASLNVEFTTVNIDNPRGTEEMSVINGHSTVHDLYVSSGYRLRVDKLDLIDPGPGRHLSTAPKAIGEVGRDGKKRKRNQEAFGMVHPSWSHLGQPQINPTPWYKPHQSQSHNMGQRLHEEICDFYDFVRPYNFEQELREGLVSRVYRAVVGSGTLKSGRILPFGSFAAGLYLPAADMDLVYVSDAYQRSGISDISNLKSVLRRVQSALIKAGIAEPRSSLCIFGAKVPIVKFQDSLTRLHVDISFNNLTGVTAVSTLISWKDHYPAAIYLIAVIKQFLLMRNANEVFNGGLGGFSICCMVVSLLQNHTAVASGHFVAENHLGQLLVEFFDLYGNHLNMATTGIRMNPPGYFFKPGDTKKDATRWTIIDPNNPDNNISGGSDKAAVIRNIFSDAHQSLLQRLQEVRNLENQGKYDTSILEAIIGGDYRSYTTQRERMRSIHSAAGRHHYTR